MDDLEWLNRIFKFGKSVSYEYINFNIHSFFFNYCLCNLLLALMYTFFVCNFLFFFSSIRYIFFPKTKKFSRRNSFLLTSIKDMQYNLVHSVWSEGFYRLFCITRGRHSVNPFTPYQEISYFASTIKTL